jgi:KaiC/GvpD/RAD55 family RecA-like ATPase
VECALGLPIFFISRHVDGVDPEAAGGSDRKGTVVVETEDGVSTHNVSQHVSLEVVRSDRPVFTIFYIKRSNVEIMA